MTNGKLHTKTEPQRYWLDTPHLFFFTSSIILLSVLNFSGGAVEIRRPVILLAGSLFSLLNFGRNSSVSVITKIILLYTIEMFFNQLSGRFVHVGSFSVRLSLIALVPLVVSFICSRFGQSRDAPVDSNDLLKSWAFVFAAVSLHMLFLFILLKNIYGYGYDHNVSVLANMCLYFLVFVFTWGQLEQTNFRRITALIFVIVFIVIMVKGT